MFLIASSCQGTANVYHHSCQHYTGSRAGNRERWHQQCIQLLLYNCRGKAYSPAQSLNKENGEKEWGSDPQGLKKRKKKNKTKKSNPYNERSTEAEQPISLKAELWATFSV